MPRTIAIGDVHGCADEFEELLKRLKLKSDDKVIQVGDLVNRGPDSHRVIKLAREYQVESIIGNHELRLITARGENKLSLLNQYDLVTLEELTKDDWNYLEAMPKLLYEAQIDTVFVHGGFLPNKSWQTQDSELITNIQVIDKEGKAAKRSDAPNAAPWADSWSGSPFVVYGHTPRPRVFERKGSIGIDTGCVYGGHLTAYIIEDKSLVQVRAHNAYAHSKHLPDPF